ncbi:unnamed protein product [Diamesa tonsa]
MNPSIFKYGKRVINASGEYEHPIDESKEEFRVYLTRSGIMDSLTKVLAKIQEMRPENPLEFLQSNLSISLVHQDVIRDLEEKLIEANREITRLQKELDEDRVKRSNSSSSDSEPNQ